MGHPSMLQSLDEKQQNQRLDETGRCSKEGGERENLMNFKMRGTTPVRCGAPTLSTVGFKRKRKRGEIQVIGKIMQQSVQWFFANFGANFGGQTATE